MVHEMITPREFLERLERKAEQLQEDISSLNDYLLMAEKWESREEYRLLWTQVKAMELLHCCMMNRIKYYKGE